MRLMSLILKMYSSFAFAEFATIECEMPGYPYVHKMSMSANLEMTADGSAYINAWIDTQKSGYKSRAKSHESDFVGSYKVFAPGEMAKHQVMHFKLFSATESSEVEYASILIDHPTKMASFVRTKDGYHYNADCKLEDIPY